MWKACAHEPIQKLAENLWRVESQMEKLPMKRAMDLVRRPNGELWIHNGVALDEPAMREIEAWGTPSVLLVPSGYHRMDAGNFKERYPSLKVYCPRGVRKRVERVVAVDGTYDDLPSSDDVRIERLEGVGDAEGVLSVRSADGLSLVFCDAVFNMPHRPGVQGFVLRLIGASGGPRVESVFRLLVMKDKRALKESLLRLSALPDLRRVLVQHEHAMGAAEFRAVAASL